jgi:hypothetical protein
MIMAGNTIAEMFPKIGPRAIQKRAPNRKMH